MAKLKIDPNEPARAAFQREIRLKRAYYDLTQSDLADALDIGDARMSGLLKRPDDLTVDRLRELCRRLRLDPAIILKLLGYTQRDIEILTQSYTDAQ